MTTRFYKVPNGALIRHDGVLRIKASMVEAVFEWGDDSLFMWPWAMVEVISPDNRCAIHKEVLRNGKCVRCEGERLFFESKSC